MTADRTYSHGHRESTDREMIDDIIVCDDDAEILDENDELATDGGVRRTTPVDDLAADEEPEERLENLAPARARAGATFSYGPVAVRDYPHGENDSVGVDDRPDTMTVEALGDREIFVGVGFGAGGNGDFGATLDEADAVRLARALLLAVDAEAPTRWPTE